MQNMQNILTNINKVTWFKDTANNSVNQNRILINKRTFIQEESEFSGGRGRGAGGHQPQGDVPT